LCDLKTGDTVQVIGPFGSSFLMPNHPGSHLVMICTGTGSAHARHDRVAQAIESQRHIRGRTVGAVLWRTHPARTAVLWAAAKTAQRFHEIHFAYSRTPGQPKRYVQDAMRDASASLAELLKDPQTHFLSAV
jgi:benzoyl-CoA 2,3-dioxygenase component A